MHSPHSRRATVAAAGLALATGALTTVPLAAHAAPPSLYFSEYVEGSANNKALEIENPSSGAVDLTGWSVRVFFNGASTASLTIPLTGSVAAGDVFVLAPASASQTVLDRADQRDSHSWFNGDDAIELVHGDTVVDSIGQVGVDPGAAWGSGDVTTADATLRRLSSSAPDSNPADGYVPVAQWTGYPKDTFDGLGLPGTRTSAPEPVPTLHIGQVQGAVSDTADATTSASPYAGQRVTVRGVVTQLAEWDAGGKTSYGFFLQEPDTQTDRDPATSDGIFVFEGSYPDFSDGHGGYVKPTVGEDITVTAKVSEYFHYTELSGATLVGDNGPAGADATVTPVTLEPPADSDDAARYWERIEGMQAQLPVGSIADSGRHVYASSHDAEAYFIAPTAPVAQRSDPYARRAFRDPHPLDDVPDQAFDNGNGYRVLVGSIGVKATAGDDTALLAPVRTFQTLTAPLTGGVYFAYGDYSLQPVGQPQLAAGVDPSADAAPSVPDRTREFSVAQYNLENLYDYRNDPTDGCDFEGDTGCPGVSPPFDYVPLSEAEYQQRLGDEATQIVHDLHSPDLMTVEEAEAQDICDVEDDQLVCDLDTGSRHSDGKPDTLQELALRITAAGGPRYDAAYDPDGADARGIVSGFLYRTDRVQLLPADPTDPVLGSQPSVDYRGAALAYNSEVSNPKSLNAVLPEDAKVGGSDGGNVFTRAPQVGHFRVWRTHVGQSTFTDVYAVANHFSSGPDSRVAQRTEQAAYNAAIATALAPTGEGVVVAGDLNTFPHQDDPLGPTGSSDQLGPLYRAGLHDLYDVLLEQVPASAYSYVFDGQAQTLDHIFVNDALEQRLTEMRAAHINADWPADAPGDGPRGSSDHDPQVATFALGTDLSALAALVDLDREAFSPQALRIVRERLDRAQRFLTEGHLDAYRSQLQALADQVTGWPARMVTREVAAAVATEARYLTAL